MTRILIGENLIKQVGRAFAKSGGQLQKGASSCEVDQQKSGENFARNRKVP